MEERLIDLYLLGSDKSLASLQLAKYHKTRFFHDENLSPASEGSARRGGLMVILVRSFETWMGTLFLSRTPYFHSAFLHTDV